MKFRSYFSNQSIEKYNQILIYKFIIIWCVFFALIYPYLVLATSAKVIAISTLFFIGTAILLLGTLNFEFVVLSLILSFPLSMFWDHYKLVNFGPIIYGVILFGWGANQIFLGKTWSITKLRHPLFPVYIVLALLGCLSGVLSNTPVSSLVAFLIMVESFIFSYIFRSLFRNRDNLVKVIHFFAFGFALEMIYTLFQFIIHFYDSFPKIFRAHGTFFHPNDLGRYSVYCIILFLSMVFSKTKFKRIYIILTFLGSLGVLMSGSRGAFLGLGVGLGTYFTLYYNLGIKRVLMSFYLSLIIIVNIAIISLAFFSSPNAASSFNDLGIESGETFNRVNVGHAFFRSLGRESIWTSTSNLIRRKPLLGYGLGIIRPEAYYIGGYTDYKGVIGGIDDKGTFHLPLFFHAHNTVLQGVLSMGILGGIFTVFLFFIPIVYGLKILPKLSSYNKGFVVSGISCQCYELFTGLFEPSGLFSSKILFFIYIISTSIIFSFYGLGLEENKNK